MALMNESDVESASVLAPAPRRPRGRPRKTLEERDDGNRRQELMRAAAKLFRAQGFAATSTRDIAAAVGMHSGSPFYHFKSKNALLCEVMEQGMRAALQQQAATLQAAQGLLPPYRSDGVVGPTGVTGVTAAQSPEVVLRALIRTHFDILLGPESDFIPVMLYEWRSLDAKQRATIAQLQRDYEAAWLPLLQALKAAGRLNADPHLARLLLLGALNWSVQWYDAEKAATLDELTDAAMALFVGAPHRSAPAPRPHPGRAETAPTSR
ncbi:MAG: TetR family transcriptional regulator [Methylibium sp. NZG]|nr:MAG: TetR family transcriptional regulator [Methylibium sp. NZG]